MNRLSKGKVLVGALNVDGDITINDDLVVSGDSRTTGVAAVKRSVATIADGASMVATAAHIMTNTIVSATPTTGRNVTTGTAAAIIALSTNFAVGDTTEFTVINLAAATHALTILGGSGVTIIGSAVVSASDSGTFYVNIASATTVVLYRK